MDGLLLIDKPIGPTSHDIVARVRRVLGERQIGHTGTLDPLASGLLALVLGRATRLARFLSASDKSYDAEIHLGVATDTYDAQGQQTKAAYTGPMPSKDDVERALDAFRGTFLQQPPAYSAKKIDGQRSYAIARRARTQPARAALPAPPALPVPVSVTAHTIEVIACNGDTVTLRVDCSAGFYIRSLAHDLGERLGTGAHLTALRRTRSGAFALAAAITVEALERGPDAGAARIVRLSAMLTELASVVLTPDGVQRAVHGRNVGPADFVAGFGIRDSRFDSQDSDPESPLHVRLLDPAGELVGIGEPTGPGGVLHPSVVLR